jgi:hypothetical protein
MRTPLQYANFYKQKKRHGIYVKIHAKTELFMKLHGAEFFLEANGRSATQENPSLLLKPKVQYCVHTGLPLHFILSQVNPVHTLPPYFIKINFNVII